MVWVEEAGVATERLKLSIGGSTVGGLVGVEEAPVATERLKPRDHVWRRDHRIFVEEAPVANERLKLTFATPTPAVVIG